MNIHLISIGGAVMHNLALELQRNGHRVSGSDDEIFEPSKTRLKNAGLLPVKMGWNANNLSKDLDVVILGMHARKDNPEIARAIELGLKIQSFPEFIAERAADKMRIVVAGSHGKTTTTAMIMHIFRKMNLDFDYLVGSKLEGFDLMVRLSEAPIMVIEGDEYLSSTLDLRPKFLWYEPQVAIITGIAWDHINVFPTYDGYKKQFDLFIKSMPEKADLYYYGHDEDLEAICKTNQHIVVKAYGIPENSQTDGITSVHLGDEKFPLLVFGDHNLANLQSAAYAVKGIGISEKDAWSALQSFPGTSNRLEKLIDTPSLVLYRDFAHSPSKVKATVDAVRASYPNHKLVAALELHTFSSLNKDFLPLYRDTMDAADVAFVHFNPHVFEMKRMEILNEEYVAEQFGDVDVITDIDRLTETVKSLKTEKTIFLMMSSGNWGNKNWKEELTKYS